MSKYESKTSIFDKGMIEIQPIIYKDIQPVITKEIQPVVNKKIQPVVHREIQTVINQNIQPVITKEIQPIIHKKIQPVIFKENQTNIDEQIKYLEQSNISKKNSIVRQTVVEPSVQREVKNNVRIKLVPYIQRVVQNTEQTMIVPETETITEETEIIEYVPYIQYKNGEIVPYKKAEKQEKKENKIHTSTNSTYSSNAMESIIAVNFVSLAYNINFPMACKKTDVFSKIEKKLYQEFPDLKSKKIYFVANSAVIDKSSTFEQNNIKSGNTILINDLLI
jgi:hypothetical protein